MNNELKAALIDEANNASGMAGRLVNLARSMSDHDAVVSSSWTLLDSARTFDGLKEVRGELHNPTVVAMLNTFASWVGDDETAWCGAFVGFICKVNGYPTPGPESWRALQARRWLTVGRGFSGGFDGIALIPNPIVVLKRGGNTEPSADVLDAPGHVGFYVDHDEAHITVFGGNQRNAVNESRYPIERVLGVRSLTR